MKPENGFVNVRHDEMSAEFFRILVKSGFSAVKAEVCAGIFLTNTLEGVFSHGVNRFPRFIKNVAEGYVIPGAEPVLVHSSGSLEQWNGNLGPGPLNALKLTGRAMELAARGTVGLAALANTNHWMRAGYYGWHAAKNGYILICWTNTCPNMPAWGAKDPRLGNNPVVFAVPYGEGAIVLDSAMSQFSYGKIESYRDMDKKLPYYGGFNTQGELTASPVEILTSWRILPAGYWKGSSMSLLLDILAAVLSGGQATHEVKSCASEHGLSQVFIAIDPSGLFNYASIKSAIEGIISDLKKSIPAGEGSEIRYPGENIARIKKVHLEEGIPVKKEIWEKIISL